MGKYFLPREDFGLLYQALTEQGYEVIGPKVKDGAIDFSLISGFEQLPWGQQEEVSPGSYRLKSVDPNRCFAWNTGPQLLKPWLFKAQQTLWLGEESEQGIRFRQAQSQSRPLAFVGVRACDIAALYLQDKHFMYGAFPDPWYSEQRHQLCLVAVNCSRSADTCFCASTGDGPEVTFGFDLLLDELDDGYLLHSKSEKGSAVIEHLPLVKPEEHHFHASREQISQASRQQKRMPSEPELRGLLSHLNDQKWQSIAQRCLACGNCTSVCPTCFCSKQESMAGEQRGQHMQVRYWDSCFTEKHGYIAGKNIRGEISQRYRQWMVHKLSTWQDQYDRSGCVGCGRCISWCPAAIDLVDEVNAMLGEQFDV